MHRTGKGRSIQKKCRKREKWKNTTLKNKGPVAVGYSIISSSCDNMMDGREGLRIADDSNAVSTSDDQWTEVVVNES